MKENCEENSKLFLQLNRSIMREIADLYKTCADEEEEKGAQVAQSTARRLLGCAPMDLEEKQPEFVSLFTIGQKVRHPVNLGYQKATIMVIGNISAGKSTFINWFVQEAVQKTGMAIETSGFTFVTTGRCVMEIGGESTLALRPHLQSIVDNYPGFLQNLSLKTCPAKNGRLKLIDLVDTPGLADGELQYPFDVEKIIIEMAGCVDLFLVFFDPIGQALGRRVLSVVEQLTDICPDKIRFCLTKIDQIRTEEERIKVLCQTTQSLTARIKSRHGFDLIPICIPGAADGTYFLERDNDESSGIVNRLNDLVEDIQRSTELRVQNALNGLHQDISILTKKVDGLLATHRHAIKEIELYNVGVRQRSIARFFFLILAGILAAFHLKISSSFSSYIVWFDFLYTFSSRHSRISHILDTIQGFLSQELLLLLWAILFIGFLLTLNTQKKPFISEDDKALYLKLTEYKNFLRTAKTKWKTLNKMYLNHAVAEHSDTTSTINETLPNNGMD